MSSQPDISHLPDYFPWYQSSQIHLITYAGYIATPDVLIALCKVFFPEFIEYRGAIFIDHGHLNFAYIDEWFTYFEGNIYHIENFVNTMKIGEGWLSYPLDNQPYQNIHYVGECIHKSWEAELKRQFPDREFEMEGGKHPEFDYYVISFWQKPASEE